MQSKNMVKHVFFTWPPTKHVVQTTGHETDAVRKIQSGMHLFFPEYIFRIHTILVNERKVGTCYTVKEVPECIIRKASTLDSFERDSLM